MEMQLIFLIVIHFFSVSSTMTRVVRPGATVTLGCSVPHKNLTMWYGHHSNKPPFVIIKAKLNKLGHKASSPKFYHGSNNGFILTLEQNNSISLTISNMTESLLGFYYCASGIEETEVGSGYVLKYRKNCFPAKSDDRNENPPKFSRQWWILMAILCLLSAVIAALFALIFTWICHRKGNNELVRTDPDQEQSKNLQEGEDGVLYSSLRFSNGGRRDNGKITHN
ncbi:hypothetical protein UPYG_G00162120 [Umbra pygmaea]|uniref:Immunoglobulin domain-containing protein n=1 Tax=Umbra pygmaea TaxID=75934 RepID=A0ABD0WRJ1_UMBPY